jgi:hypothetical protein
MTLADLEKYADEYGAESAKGGDAQIKFALKIVEGSYHGAIDREKNKYGVRIGDAYKLAERYTKARGNALFNIRSKSGKKLTSCFNKLIELGQWTKGGQGEPLGTTNDLMTVWVKQKAIPANAKKMDDAFNTLMKFARVQVKRDTLVEKDELTAMCFKKESALPDEEDILVRARKTLMDVANGTAAQKTVHSTSKHIQSAIDDLTKRLKEIAKEKAA